MVSRFKSGLAAAFLLSFALSPERFLEDEVHFLISSRERAEFAVLARDEDRESFIERFWVLRDPTPGTLRNEAREAHERRLSESDLLFRMGALRGRHSERGRVHQLLGPPRFRESFDASPLVPLELWHYTGVASSFLPESFYLIFFRPPGDARYLLFRPPTDGIGALLQDGQPGRHLLGPRLTEIARIDLELAAAIESLAPGGESATVQLLASLDALPDLLDRNRREVASVRSEASFRDMPATLEAVLLYDDAGVPEIHYALELAPEVTKPLLASPRKRFTIQGALIGRSGELDRWEDTLEIEIEFETLEPGRLSFQGRRLAPPLAERVEIALVDERGESAFASAEVSRLLLARGVRELEDLDRELPFRVGDRILSPVSGGVVSDPGAGDAHRARVLVRERTPREEASYRRARASAFSRRGDRARAIEELALAVGALPDDVRLQLELASFRYASGRHEEAVEQLRAAKAVFTKEVDILVLLAASLESLGRIEEAAALFEEALTLAPENEALRRARSRLVGGKSRRDR
jgi:GWxTD domain-containing protein